MFTSVRTPRVYEHIVEQVEGQVMDVQRPLRRIEIRRQSDRGGHP